MRALLAMLVALGAARTVSARLFPFGTARTVPARLVPSGATRTVSTRLFPLGATRAVSARLIPISLTNGIFSLLFRLLAAMMLELIAQNLLLSGFRRHGSERDALFLAAPLLATDRLRGRLRAAPRALRCTLRGARGTRPARWPLRALGPALRVARCGRRMSRRITRLLSARLLSARLLSATLLRLGAGRMVARARLKTRDDLLFDCPVDQLLDLAKKRAVVTGDERDRFPR